ncbi:MAG: YvrJ family protein [Clostridiales bacterium]|nr:YvrJ family protein [Clostridiales bacterium]
MELFVDIVGNIGFPIVVAAFLLIRVERKLEEINKRWLEMLKILATQR